MSPKLENVCVLISHIMSDEECTPKEALLILGFLLVTTMGEHMTERNGVDFFRKLEKRFKEKINGNR